jgi:hypothetical protein
MRSRTITAIIISGYSLVAYTFATSTTAPNKSSFIHMFFITLLVFETSEMDVLEVNSYLKNQEEKI